MPELPEVETIVRSLKPKLLGRKITSARLLWQRTLVTPRPTEFSLRVRNCKFVEISRLGKFIVFGLETPRKAGSLRRAYLLLHLRMSGSLSLEHSANKLKVHDRAAFTLDNRYELRFNDIRKFGRLYFLDDHKEVTGKLGPDAILQTPTAEEFFLALHSRKVGLKSLLLDQSFLAGLGNIYVDESLWLAGAHPRKLSNRLTRQQSDTLRNSILKVLRRAIRFNGTDAGDGVVAFGRNTPKVYGRAGEPCKRCRTKIERIVVGQRGTHFCPKCQKPC